MDFDRAIDLIPDSAAAYTIRGLVYANKEQWDQSIQDWNNALRLEPDIPDIKDYLAVAYYTRGEITGNKGNYDNAITDFSFAIDLKPDFSNAYWMRGKAYGLKKQWDECIQDWYEVLKLEPDNPEVVKGLAMAYRERGNVYAQNGQLDQCIEDWNEALRHASYIPGVKEDLANAWNNRGNIFAAQKDLDQAIENYNQAMNINPNDALAYYNRGTAYREKVELDLAIEDYKKAIDINPNYIDAYVNRGLIYGEREQWDLCIQDLEKVLSFDNEERNIQEILATAYWMRGIANGINEDSDGAIYNFNRAIELESNFAEAYYYRGMVYYFKEQWDRCIQDLNNALELQLEEPELKENLANAYNRLGYIEITNGNHDRAIINFNQAIELRPNFYDAFVNLGNTYADIGNLAQAIEEFSKAIIIDPNNAVAWNNRGNAYKDKGELNRAIEEYNKAISIDTSYAAPWNNRGMLYYEMGMLDWAIEDLNKAIALDPNYAMAWNNRGSLFFKKGMLDWAIENLNKAIVLDPNLAWAWNNRGLVYFVKGEMESAIDDYNKAITLDSNDFKFWNNRGMAYYAKGELDQAINDFNKTISINPNDYAWNNRGIVYFVKGNLNQAIEDFSKAINTDPNEASAYNNRGIAFFHKGELDRAIDDFNKAISLNPNHASAWNNRGNVYQAKGELDRAIDDYWQSIDAADKSADILDIFYYTWGFIGSLYEYTPYLHTIVITNDFEKKYIALALEVLNRSITKAEKARSNLGSRGTDIMSSIIYQYYAGVDFETTFGSSETAFVYSEWLRSRGFLNQMGTEAALKLEGIDLEDIQKVRDLIQDIDNYQNLRSKLNPQMDADRYAQASIALTKAEDALAVLDTKISAQVPRYAELRNPKLASPAESMDFCGNDRVILEYVLWDSSVEYIAPNTTTQISSISKSTSSPPINSYCLVITKDGITPVRLDPEFDYAKTIKSLREKVMTITRTGPFYPEEEFEAERNALYKALVKPVLDKIPDNIINIIIVPDGNLASLPFDILRENNNPGTRSLGERYSITLSPSVSVSMLASQTGISVNEPIIAFGGAWYEPYPGGKNPNAFRLEKDYEGRLAALGEQLRRGNTNNADQEKMSAVDYFYPYGRNGWVYLDGTVAEIQGLEKIVTAAPRIIQGKDVSERRIKELSLSGELLNYPIIHFACHGFFNDYLTPQAALVFSEVSGQLSGESDEDGYLSIEEIVLLQLKARMVMMSACQTGLGNIKRGDGMVGLARAFMVAGAQNVGVSLWEIDDEATTEFMWNIYRKVIREGKIFRDAYREVKEEFRNGIIVSRDRQTDWSHPYYWAAFTMYE